MEILGNQLHQMKHTIDSDPDDIWETLNKRCHDKFGFGECIKEKVRLEDLQCEVNTLTSYTMWNKFSQYHIPIKNWIEKLNIALKRKQMRVNNFK